MESFQNSKGFKPKSVMSLCYDSKGNLWMGTFEDGVIKYIP
ncbi:MAG: two-component regulator propeller domain-containing protein [Bacteroidota bacterium]